LEERIKLFRGKILAWFEDHMRVFPWREDNLSAYELIIAEILLQRTKAETVSKFYKSFILEFPNWEALSTAGLPVIEEFIKPIGLYRQRAARLQKLADYMVKHNGSLPSTRVELDAVPFMGQYIANAVELFIYNRNKPLLDVNMARVLERYFGPRVKADIRHDEYLQSLAYEVVRHEKSKEISWAILDFAAIICQARIPKCSICSLLDTCKYFKILQK